MTIDEYIELKKLKEKYNKIKYLLFEKESGLPLMIDEEETIIIKKIKNIIRDGKINE